MVKPVEKENITPDPDPFRELVKECIGAYEELNNDTLALDFCKVSDKRLRALVVNDEEYQRETKSIYARQRLEEVREVDYLAKLAASDDKAAGEEYVHPSERGKGGTRKNVVADRDILTMRFRAAQMKRELMRDMAAAAGDVERDMIYLMFVPATREELEGLITTELSVGSGDADLDSLITAKEAVPEGTAKLRRSAITATGDDDDDNALFDVLPDGEIVERR